MKVSVGSDIDRMDREFSYFYHNHQAKKAKMYIVSAERGKTLRSLMMAHANFTDIFPSL
jgi:hypothetical protein